VVDHFHMQDRSLARVQTRHLTLPYLTQDRVFCKTFADQYMASMFSTRSPPPIPLFSTRPPSPSVPLSVPWSPPPWMSQDGMWQVLDPRAAVCL
jgi:hypothetical protein